MMHIRNYKNMNFIQTIRFIGNKIGHYLWLFFLNGLLTVLPIVLTIALFNFSIKVLQGWLKPIYDLEPEFLQAIPFSEIILTIVIIFAIGTVIKLFLLEPLWHRIEKLLMQIPLFRTVYSGIKQLVHAINPQDKVSFKQVVMVEFPRTGLYSIGFQTSELPQHLCPIAGERFYNIFIPTTPNPTSGFFIVAREKDIMITTMTRQEAMTMIISGGIITPDTTKSNSNQ